MFRRLFRHLQEDLLSCAQKKLQHLVTDRKIPYTWVYNIIFVCLKDHIYSSKI
jgi:hypothetical protein